MTGIEDTLTYKAAELLAYEHPELDAELKEALFEVIGKLKDAIIYHVLGSGRSASEIISYLANTVTRDYDGRMGWRDGRAPKGGGLHD